MNYAIILSGGSGTRLGASIPKQYLTAGGRPIISYCLEIFANHSDIDGLVVVAAKEWHGSIKDEMSKISNKTLLFAEPGETRQLSIFNGLNALKNYGDDDWVIIHDAARPLVSDKLISDCLSARDAGFDGSMPVIPVKDTIYQSNDKESITGLLDRNTLFAGQAPEAFNLNKYLKAHNNMTLDELLKINGSSELAYKIGLKIKLVPGDTRNFKITDSSDLERFISLLQ